MNIIITIINISFVRKIPGMIQLRESKDMGWDVDDMR